jgi:CheY-like chemotaxis protein
LIPYLVRKKGFSRKTDMREFNFQQPQVLKAGLPNGNALAAGESAAPDAVRAGEAGGKRVLVMDDEESILNLISKMLGSQGYDVKQTMNGADAVEEYRGAKNAGTPFDIVILDLTVPQGMGGFEALKAMQAMDPGVKSIVSSGYSDDPVVVNYRQHGIAAVAPKPYRVAELIRVVQGVLAA